MNRARLRYYLELQRNAPGLAGHERADNWSTFACVWSERRDPKGDEIVSALQTRSMATVTFRIHWRDDVTLRDRVMFGTREFGIKSITVLDEHGRRDRWLLLHCVEAEFNGNT